MIDIKFVVTIDNKLSWEIHRSNLNKKLKSATGLLARIHHNIPFGNANEWLVIFLCNKNDNLFIMNNILARFLSYKSTVSEYY